MKETNYKNFIDFFVYFDIKKKKMFVAGFLLLLVTIITLIQPKVWALVLDGLYSDKTVKYLTAIAVIFLVTQFTEIVLSFAQNIYVQKIQQKLSIQMRLYMLREFLKMDYMKYGLYNKGELISRLNGDSDEIANGIVSELIGLAFGILKTVIIIVLLLLTNIWMTGIVLFLQVISYFLIKSSDVKLKKVTQEFAKINDDIVSSIEMVVRGFNDIKNLRIERDALNKSDSILKNRYTVNMKYMKTYINYQNKTIFFNYLFQFCVLIIGIILVKYNELEFYDFVASSSYSSMFSSVVSSLYGFKASYINCFNSVNRFYELVGDIGDGIHDDGDIVDELNDKIESYELKELYFSYPGANYEIISNLSADFYKGYVNYIIGSSGCGKTTLLMLIAGFYKENRGNRRINGIEIDTMRLPRAIVIGQEPFFFDETILYNLSIVNKTKGMEEIENACRIANIYDEMQRLPEGINTTLINNGTNLSYGQRQRLALARGLLTDCNVILLDEILSNVDSVSKEKIITAIRIIARDKIVIFVTHDIGLIRPEDNVYSFDKGIVND